MLSFDDHLHVPQYLPEICHALALLVSTGSPLIRATVHGLVINLVHGLCTATATLMTTKKVTGTGGGSAVVGQGTGTRGLGINLDGEGEASTSSTADAPPETVYSTTAASEGGRVGLATSSLANSRRALEVILKDLSSPRFRALFGLNGDVQAFLSTGSATPNVLGRAGGGPGPTGPSRVHPSEVNKQEGADAPGMPLASLETMVRLLLDVMMYGGRIAAAMTSLTGPGGPQAHATLRTEDGAAFATASSQTGSSPMTVMQYSRNEHIGATALPNRNEGPAGPLLSEEEETTPRWTISGTEMANAWRARWMSLVTSTAFQFNPALQPRAFVVLGCLARSEVDDDILYQVLVTLKGALCMFNEGNCSLIVSIIMCLAKIAENLPADSRYLLPLFWLAMSFVHIGHVPLFPPALTLMEVVLRNMQSKGFFASASLGSVLLEARKPLEDLLHLKDGNSPSGNSTIASVRQSGIPTTKAFQKHFPFAVAMSLIKGLKHPHTQAATIQALTTFLEIASRSTPEDAGTVDPQVLGFLAPLLPQASKAGELRELFWLVGVYRDDDDEVNGAEDEQSTSQSIRSGRGGEGEGSVLSSDRAGLRREALEEHRPSPASSSTTFQTTHSTGGSSSMSGMTTSLATSYHRIFDRLNIPDRDTALLLIALMVTLLNNAESESDQLFLYGFLAESATALPGVFIHFYDTLLPKMNAVFSSNHSVPILGAVQAIFYTLLAIQREDMDRRNPRILLRELGFEGLAEAGTFDSVTKEQKKAYADLASAAVGRVIG